MILNATTDMAAPSVVACNTENDHDKRMRLIPSCLHYPNSRHGHFPPMHCTRFSKDIEKSSNSLLAVILYEDIVLETYGWPDQ